MQATLITPETGKFFALGLVGYFIRNGTVQSSG